MRIYYYLLCILVCYSVENSYLLAQTAQNDMPFDTFIKGVRFASIELNEAEQKKVDETESIFLKYFKNYLKEIGFKKVAAKPAMVVFPDPEVPTKAVTVPAGASKVIPLTTSFPDS